MWADDPRRPTEGIESHGSGVTGCFKPPHIGDGTKLRLSARITIFITTKLSLCPWSEIFK